MKLVRIILVGITAAAAMATVGLGIGVALGVSPSVTASAINGVNFEIHSQIDSNFCIEVQNGTIEGRTLSLQTCGGADTQRWVLTKDADSSNLLVDSQGMCVNGRSRGLGLPLTVGSCQFGAVWRFAVTDAGLIVNERNGKCLSVPGAASNAVISLATCDGSRMGQLWGLTH
jgi:Ricin-type beta-trefoil lectin domain